MKGKRIFCLLLSALLLFSLAPGAARADTTVYFTAVNDQLLSLSDDTMPFWSGGRLYLSSTAISGSDLGVFYSRSRDKQTVVVYRQGSALTFDLSSGAVNDQNGRQYGGSAIVRGDVVFLPIELLTQFFALDYSYTRISYGYLVRIKSDTVVLSDAKFIDAAAAPMAQRYNEYIKSHSGGLTPGDTPRPSVDSDTDRVYLTLPVTDAALSLDLLSSLEDAGAKATFLFTEKQLADSGDLLRRLRVGGSAVALRIDASGGSGRTISAIERANDALWTACNRKTRLVVLEDAADATVRAVRNAGYCPIIFDLDYSAGLPASATRTANAVLRAARSGGCTVLLGSDSAVQEDWSAFLNRLRAGALPIAALNELSARRSGS